MSVPEIKRIGLNYSSLAFPPKGIDLAKSYMLEICGKNYTFLENGVKKSCKLEFIKHYFTPAKGSWEGIILY